MGLIASVPRNCCLSRILMRVTGRQDWLPSDLIMFPLAVLNREGGFPNLYLLLFFFHGHSVTFFKFVFIIFDVNTKMV